MALNLIADQVLNGRLYPALTQHQARPYTQAWREFGNSWPYTIPLRLQEYCEYHGVHLSIADTKQPWLIDSWYPIGLGFFDFHIDYFSLLPPDILAAVISGKLRLLFYYHEGDNPQHIKKRLDNLVLQHRLPKNCYCFVSANTAARQLENFVYFTDFELWYWQRNREVPATPMHQQSRFYDFTILSRLHKTWRAIAMADLDRLGILQRSLWSYCETGQIQNDSPIEIDILHLREATEKFLNRTPRYADTLSQQKRNDHSETWIMQHTESWCNIVLETHFDADGSNGVFVTEKTFKPIKHGQLFFIVGCAGTLALLESLGYQVFNDVLDNSYDQETNATRRWQRLRGAIQSAQPHLEDLFNRARDQISHNQTIFMQTKTERLNNLLEQIHAHTK